MELQAATAVAQEVQAVQLVEATAAQEEEVEVQRHQQEEVQAVQAQQAQEEEVEVRRLLQVAR